MSDKKKQRSTKKLGLSFWYGVGLKYFLFSIIPLTHNRIHNFGAFNICLSKLYRDLQRKQGLQH